MHLNLVSSFIQLEKEITFLDHDQQIPVTYHNFIIVNKKFKNTGLTITLFEYFYRGMQERKQRQPQLSLLTYYVTATPSIIYQTDKVFLNMVPSINNYNRMIFTDQEWHIANELRKLRNWPTGVKSSNVNPFVLKGIMKSHYTTHEQMRIDKIGKKTNYKIFQDLGIDESNGDQLLRFAFV
ncbi:unnamed protein product [Rotaria sp. Silwood2]|nr:unnamed protein product [Rotaria sp. Silwood2]CAF2957178.1 unnamed protein product [Rotaria sp. Silwood2]CAF4370054.1 unnamed protein product [Rotaria sp. Silwood2]CAF4475928.1 unnamed protein product [Rotaria sp. Silwood2]